MLGQYEMKSDLGHPGRISLATGGHFCMGTHSSAILNLVSFTISPKHICSSSLYLSFPGAFLLHEGSNSDRAEKEGELFYLRQASIVPVRYPSCTQRLPHFPLKENRLCFFSPASDLLQRRFVPWSHQGSSKLPWVFAPWTWLCAASCKSPKGPLHSCFLLAPDLGCTLPFGLFLHVW